MIDSSPPVTIAFRIPGPWKEPRELVERLPKGCRCNGEALVFPDGTEVDFGAAPPDDQFAGIFRSSLRQEATAEELATVDEYAVNIFLSGPGGSMESAHTMMKAAAVLIRAGGAGVFIDNSGLAHGGQDWLAMTEDGGSDALSFAFVTIVAGPVEIHTMGMHTLGLRDIVMKRSAVEVGGFDIVEVIRYLCRQEKSFDVGHIVADLDGPRFQAFADGASEFRAGSPMHNPFGRLKLVSMRDIAEKN